MTARNHARTGLQAARCGLAVLAASVLAIVGVAPPAVAGPAPAGPAGTPPPAGVTPPAYGAVASPVGDGAAGHGRPGRWRFDATAVEMSDVARVVGADRLWREGVTGAGVGVALVDTGVVPVDGLRAGNVVNGPDLSVESQVAAARYLDTHGHGTHLAGVIAGSGTGFRGIAPGATLTSVKVGAFDGTVDVSQVIAAVDWVVAHRDDDPARPIRVLNLAYGTDGVQDHRLDPLAHAVENAWRAGIVVVVAAGNGADAARPLANPAYDPYVITVGAADTAGTVATADDRVCDFSGRGTPARRVDLVAPGRSIVSLRDPGGAVDAANPAARIGERFFKGSGTSQAAAVVSGAVALLLQRQPQLSPDQVKAALIRGANALPAADAAGQGGGELDVARAAHAAQRPAGPQTWPASTGLGSLEAARGSAHIAAGTVVLRGEVDLWGPFDGATWARASAAGSAWAGGRWMGREVTGDGWTGASWTGRTWSGVTWSGTTWSGLTWSGTTWSGTTWSGVTWSGTTWSGVTWSGVTWSGTTWSEGAWGG